MLRATIEIVPFGDEELKREIATLEIANIGPSSEYPNYADYAITLFKSGERQWRYIENWPRRLGAEALVAAAIGEF